MPLYGTQCLPIIACLVLIGYAFKCLRFGNRPPLPPGPQRLPIVGNALNLPTKNAEVAYRDMNARYGDVVYLDALGQPMVILGSHEAAIDLLEKRSSIYSDRGNSVIARLSGWVWVLSLQHYGSLWRRSRRTFHQYFNSNAIGSYCATQEREAHRYALDLINEPTSLHQRTRLMFASLVIRIVYGIELSGVDDEFVSLAEAATNIFSAAFVPGKYMVEVFPLLRFLPSWLPGVTFKRECKAWERVIRRVRDAPWERALNSIRDGTAEPSVLSSILKRIAEGKEAADQEESAKSVAATAYLGGADTILSTVQAYFLAMASFPEVQAQAQAELDAVVGPHRLPRFSDQASLPYMSALVKECLRWRSVAPLGFPHRSIADDVFRGYFIPKGTLVVANIWAYSRDVRHYPDAERFAPERFLRNGVLDPDVLDPAAIAFGYGRRICPGRHFAESSLWILIATVLHVFSIRAPLDTNGKPIKLEGRMTPGIISYPEPFNVDIKPRAPWAEALIRDSCGS